jgi:hypothetical protein
VTLDDFTAHPQYDALHARLFCLFADRLQRFLERQARAQQGRQLARQQGQIERRQTAAHETAGAAFLQLALRRFLDFHRQQLFVAQQLADMLGRVAFDQTFAFSSLRIERGVFERAHQSSRVTRSTSSSVVSPATTFLRPSSRMPGLAVRA